MQNRTSPKSLLGRLFTPAIFSLASLLITGCGANFVSTIAPNTTNHPAIYGTLHGGQQPVVGASIQLYAAGAPTSGGGYGQGAIPLILGTLPITDQNGNFVITGDYVPPVTPAFFYIVATSGSPGFGTPINPDINLMTTIGGCTPTIGLSPSTSVEINEVTTAATSLALQPYFAQPALTNNLFPSIGAPSTDILGLENAFQAVNNLVDTSTGIVIDPAKNTYASADNGLLLNTYGDILASCVNSNPLLDTSCFHLFADATPTGSGVYPATDTGQASSYMAANPTNNVPALFGLIPPQAPFVGFGAAPTAFAVTLANLHSSCEAPINLGSLTHFELLAGSTITATQGTKTSIVSGGDMGLYGGSSITGFGTGPAELVPPGMIYIGDSTALQAQSDLTAAINQISTLSPAVLVPADISGYILPPGLYKNASSLAFTSNITLDAQGDSSAQFIFQIGSTLTTSGNTQILLLNGAQAKNVFWQVGSSATIGLNSDFEGTILAGASITLGHDAVVHGRALASTAAVGLDGSNVVSAP
jgi:hypothetical protein